MQPSIGGDVRNGQIHVDFPERLLTFRNAPSVLTVGEPKGRKRRAIPLTPGMEGLLERARTLGRHSEGDFVFADKDGRRAAGLAIAGALKRRAEEAGIASTSMHEIRRAVSSLLRRVLPTDTVASLLGRTPEMNTSNYAYDAARTEGKIAALAGLPNGCNKSNQEKGN